MKKALVFTVIVIAILAISYGITVLITALGLWALVKLGVLSAWTWKRAALWGIIVFLIELCTTKVTKKGD